MSTVPTMKRVRQRHASHLFFRRETYQTLHKRSLHTPGWNANGSAKTPQHDLLFEGVVINSKDYDFKTSMSRPEQHDASERQRRQAMGQKSKALEAYNEKYIGQMQDIMKGMFANEKTRPGYDPANPDNWVMSQNIVWGGTSHQHPHCDQGKAGCFTTDQIFPFVCIHGFGLHEFTMWLLPAKKKREYRFPFSVRTPNYVVHNWNFGQQPQLDGHAPVTPIGLLQNRSLFGRRIKLSS
jgi:hypothetical protein